MNRRTLIAGLGGVAASPLVAQAQQSERVKRVGVLMPWDGKDPEVQSWVRAFVGGLQSFGWTDGGNIQLELRWAAADMARFRKAAAELVGMAPRAILSVSEPALIALRETPGTTAIVFLLVTDPVGNGFVPNLAHPGGYITGFSAFEAYVVGGKWLQLLKSIAPNLERITVIKDPGFASSVRFINPMQVPARLTATQLTVVDVRNQAEVQSALEAAAREPKTGIIVLPAPATIVHRDLIVRLAADYRLPAIYPYRFFVTNGGLISYGLHMSDMFRQAASYVDRVLKGENPGDLPVQQQTKYDFAVNIRTAKALGLEMPTTMLALADEVIE